MEVRGFIGPNNVAQSPIVDCEETVNLYLEVSTSPSSTTQYALYPIPGVQTLATHSAGKGRAHFAMAGREFVVIGTEFIEINSDGVLTTRGTVADDGLPATISSNGDGGEQLFITAGGNGYSYNLNTNALSAVAALAGIATMGASMDGFGLCLDADSSTVYISDLNDFTTWDPTNFIQRSQAPDPWVALAVSNKYLYLFGTQTSEPWYNAGTSPIAFQPTATVWNFGVAAPWSVEVSGGSVAWIGSSASGDNMVLKASGLTPEVISNFATEYAFDNMPQVDDAIGDSYDYLGHNVWTFTFPFANQTWTYDESTKSWAKKGSWDTGTGEYNLWRPLYHAFAFGQHRLLDIDGPKVYVMSAGYSTDIDGTSGIRWLRRAPAQFFENQRLFFSTFELFIEVGLGAVTGQGSDPQVAMRQSNDGGKTFGSPRFRSVGALGEYGKRVRWTRCGSGRKRVFEVYGSDPIPFRLLGAFLS